MRQLLLPALLTVALATGCSTASTASPGQTPSTAPADLAALAEQYGLQACPETDPDAVAVDGGLPATALSCLDGSTTVNLAGLPRTPTIINFWAQWCGPCRVESPFLREAAAQLEGVSFLGVDYDDPQPDWAIEFASLAGFAWPHVMDPDRSLRAELSIAGIPTTFFVGADGRIAGVHAGQLESTEQLLDLAEKYLEVS